MKSLRYCPQLNPITGSITSSLLMCQLEYWFQKRGNKPFYKFLSPCQDEHYQVGDSWTEELGFSKTEFRTAFSKIGTAYKTKTAYKKSTDPFKGQLYLSYYDRIRKLTYYMRNDDLVDKFLRDCDCALPYSLDYNTSQSITKSYSSLYTADNTMPSLTSTNPKAISVPITLPTSSSTCTLPTYSVAPELISALPKNTPASVSSHAATSTTHSDLSPNQPNSLTTYSANLHATSTRTLAAYPTAANPEQPSATPKLSSTIPEDFSNPGSTPYAQILDLFHKCCPSLNKITALNASCKRKLDTLYHKLLAQSADVLGQLEKVFKLTEASDFLCGRGTQNSFKAAFGWIIRLDKFFAILNGNYASHKPSSSKSHYSPRPTSPKPSSTFMHMYTHGFNIQELEAREQAYLEKHYGLL